MMKHDEHNGQKPYVVDHVILFPFLLLHNLCTILSSFIHDLQRSLFFVFSHPLLLLFSWDRILVPLASTPTKIMPRTPSIRFRYGFNALKNKQSTSSTSSTSSSSSSSSSTFSWADIPAQPKATGLKLRNPDVQVISFEELPSNYRPLVLTEEAMELINSGGAGI
eukprot:TRINITY_DN419_c0_g1_i2.p1 TRINITY_DN419_c0_g1~~TRINITY_DN419_c0_g1_i2.p1  ORF type:complete len:165 (-),score=28.82 TRINITY_DN419_c0_g1_i2:3-497(-)